MSGDLQAACRERGWGLEKGGPKTCTDGVRTPAGTLPPPLTDTQTICILNVHRHIFSTRAAGAHVGGSRQCSRGASVSQGCRWDSRAAAQLSPTLLLLSSPRTPLTMALPPLVPKTWAGAARGIRGTAAMGRAQWAQHGPWAHPRQWQSCSPCHPPAGPLQGAHPEAAAPPGALGAGCVPGQ